MKCRICLNNLTEKCIDLGKSPIANNLLSKENLENDRSYPLEVYICTSCWLAQLGDSQQPNNIFSDDYPYFSSFSSTWLEHAKKMVFQYIDELGLDKDSFVVEVASNDGYLLQYFKEKNIPFIGIEPVTKIAKKAIEKGIPTLDAFFNKELALDLVNKYQPADLIVANNVLAHVPDLIDFIKGLKILLSKNGVLSIEFPHLLQLIKLNQFDTIYHEHYSYFSLFTVKEALIKEGLEVFDVEELSTHGGSLRLKVKQAEDLTHSVKSSVKKILAQEVEEELTSLERYKSFQNQIALVKKRVLKFMDEAKRQNKTVVGYGAPAKGNTLLNYCGLTDKDIQYTVDLNPAKQNHYLPGSHIPVKSPDEVFKTKPDYLLIFPWNLKNEIIDQMSSIREWGGKFVVPIPELDVIA